MYPAPFDYHAPSTIEQALALLNEHRDNAKILAGGHSLLPMMKLRLAAPGVVVDVGGIPGLAGIKAAEGEIVIGPMTTHHGIESSALVGERVPLLAEVAARIGDVQVRNRGTIGGSIAHADPAADWPAALLALEARVITRSASGASRTIPATAFFLDLMTTALAADELITEIRVPVPARGGHAYEKVRQPASGFALVGVAVQLAVEASTCRAAAIGLTGISSRPTRATTAESALAGRTLTREAIAEAAERVTDHLDVLGDIHASSEFRAHLARVHARRALARAAGL